MGIASAELDYAVTPNCPSTLNAGDSCTANVVFTPTASGTRNGVLTVATTTPASGFSVNLTGTGVQASAQLGTTSQLTRLADGSYQAVIVVKNTGTAAANAVTLTGAILGTTS